MPSRRLTDRQKGRIRKIQDRRRGRMQQRPESSLEHGDTEAPRPGRVVVRYGTHLAVEGEDREIIHCLFRQNLGGIVCGDRVVWCATDPGQGVVTAVLERKSVLARPDYAGREKPLAANIAQLIAVVAPRPEPSGFLVDQYLVTAELIGVSALIAVNKTDLLDDQHRARFLERFACYAAIGYPVIAVSAKAPGGLAPLATLLQRQTSILVGQSGVGKSSLIKALLPDRQIQVGRLSEATDSGRHTTSATTLYTLPESGELIDSPGVRSFRLLPMNRQDLERGFREFAPYVGQCRFSDCTHDHEPGCALIGAVAQGTISAQRLESFRLMARKIRPESKPNKGCASNPPDHF